MLFRRLAAAVMAAFFVSGALGADAFAQHQPTPQQLAGIAKDAARHFGDDPDNAGPIATDLSYSIRPDDVAKAMRKVADWQLARSQPYFDRIWTWSVLYSGFMAASDSLGDPKYRNAMQAMGQKYDWKLRSHLPNADDQSVAQTYLELYLLKRDPEMLKPTRDELDAILAAPAGATIPRGRELTWWWCDALFMAPPVWSRMYAATGDRKYIDYLDAEWTKTSSLLYDTKEHLYARDTSYLTKTEANGKKMFWSRGNGWVMGGIIRTLEYLPNDDPARARYITQLQEMAARVTQLQGADGLWRAGLLDPADYDQPEVSGSALITFALAAGVNDGYLDAKTYRPVIEKAWAGMLHHVYADGRLGCIQQTGAEPAPFKPTASYTYGVGAFLLASSEIRKMDQHADLHQGFLNPPDDARPIMRWWWFGPSVTEPELKKELETMQRAGIGGVEIQPVYPLMLDDEAKGIRNVPYMSPEFLSSVSFANKTARSLGLRVDITLGSGWPYGGPHTTLTLAAGRLKVAAATIAGGKLAMPALAEGDSLIAAFAVKGTAKSFDAASATRIDPTKDVPPELAGETALFFIASHTRQQVKRPAAGAEGYVLDHFSRAALDEHLTDVAAPLLKAFGDEPPYSVFSDSLEVYGADWTPNLPAEFLRRRGYDLIPHLPELLAGGTAEAESVRHDWGVTLSDLIRENYLQPLTQFAAEHHTRFRSQTYGIPAVTLADEAAANLPEGEGPQWREFSFTRWASSANHIYGNNVTSAETWTWLHSPAFRATPLDMKAEADRMFLLGVNQFVGHGYPYSPAAAGEPGWAFYAAAVFNSHNPWFAVMPEVTKYLQRVSWLLRQGEPANDVAILLPEDDAQAAFAPGHDSVTDEMRRRIKPELMSAILDAGYNVDYIDAATIDKLDAIPYPVLILPPTDRIPLAAYRRIERYADAGGKVIAIGKLPSLAPGLKEQADNPEIAALSKRLFADSDAKGTQVASIDSLPAALHRALPPDFDVEGQTAGLGFIHRRLADRDVYFVANTSNQPADARVRFRSASAGYESWNPDIGKILEAGKLGADSRIRLALAPYESRIFVLSGHVEEQAQPATAQEKQVVDLSHDWRLSFPGGTSQTLATLTSWTDLAGKKNYSGEGVYSRSFKLDKAAAHVPLWLDFGVGVATTDPRPPNANGVRALLDPPIREAAIVVVNGRRVGALWHPPYRIDVSPYVRVGENTIEVHVYNTAINLLAGQPPRDYTALRAKYGRRFDPQDMDNLEPVPSGLFGPVRLMEGTEK